ncbi:MAG TPA: hypothetical protein VIO35_04780, partial [Chloroflexota bacterium]
MKHSIDTDDLSEILAAARFEIVKGVEADGADQHQIELDRLVWSHAHAQAAIALQEWADLTSDPLAAALAEIGHRRALSSIRASDHPPAPNSDL